MAAGMTADSSSASGREAQVRSMFDRIATRYDLMNSVMSAGLHHRWRSRAADLASLKPGEAALDVCCGTGDLALELKRRVGSGGTVVGLDFSEPMLALAQAKSARLPHMPTACAGIENARARNEMHTNTILNLVIVPPVRRPRRRRRIEPPEVRRVSERLCRFDHS